LDKRITEAQLEALLLVSELKGQARMAYLDELLIKDKYIAYILSISASSLSAKLPHYIDHEFTKTINVSKTVEFFLQLANKSSNGLPTTSTYERLLFDILNSPQLLGVSADTLNKSFNLPSTPEAILVLLGDREIPEVTSMVKSCGVCRREMKSVDTTGVCVPCKSRLIAYTTHRVEAFKVPINHFNIPNLKKQSKVFEPINFTFEQWEFKLIDDCIYVKPFNGSGIYKQGILPFVEYQKSIID